MSQPESNLSRRIMDAIRTKPMTFCFKVHGSEHVMAGLPDIIACVDGKFLGLEVKMPGKEDNTSKRQDFVHAQIRHAGGRVYVVSSVDQVLGIIDGILAGQD